MCSQPHGPPWWKSSHLRWFVTVVASPYDDQALNLKSACDRGNRSACIRFGIMIGKHQERVAAWRRIHPDFFSYED